MDLDQRADFIQTVWGYYRGNKRNFKWREFSASYNVLVSEFMLQQTQTARVVPKFDAWMHTFPSIQDLAKASWEDVLNLWVGLGYNRRARNLQLTARKVIEEYHGVIPQDKKQLMSLPGIGDYTSSAIRAFAFNLADPFLETNIRTVYLLHFFKEREGVPDSEILQIIEKTLDYDNPREWYWALMDYGVFLKQTHGNANTRSKHYTKQSAFKGSTRELRSHILKSVLSNTTVAEKELLSAFAYDPRSPKLINHLVKEGLIKYNGTHYSI